MILTLKCWKCQEEFPFNAEVNEEPNPNVVYAIFPCPCDKKVSCQLELHENEVPKQMVMKGGEGESVFDLKALQNQVVMTTEADIAD